MTLTTEQQIDRLGMVLEEVLAELRHIRVELAERVGASSSVEVKTSTRGADCTVKAYVGSDVRAAGEAAMEEYTRIVAELNERLAGALNGKPG